MEARSERGDAGYLRVFPDPVLRDVEISRAVRYPLQTQRRISEDGYGLHLVEAGPGRFRYRRFGGDAPPGRMLVVEPGEPLVSSMESGGLLTGRALSVSAKRVREAWATLGGSATSHAVFSFPLVRDADFVASFVATHVAFEEGAPLLARECALARLLYTLLKRYADHAWRPDPPAERNAVRRARSFLEANACVAVRLDAVAEAVGLNKFYLAHAFHTEVGVSPHQYQLALRIDRAKQLLARGAHPGPVAFEVGFADQSHLNRHFKRMVGVTPGSYQRSVTGREAPPEERRLSG